MDFILLSDWRFRLDASPEAFGRGFDDSGWAEVVVPHDWSVGLPFSEDYPSATGYLAGGVGWYRASFTLPDAPQKVFLQFDGVYRDSQVWCNGCYLGRRPSGYAGFSYDVSAFVSFGGRANTVAVRVGRGPGGDSRWATGAGLYRKVRVALCEPVYADEVFFTSEPTANGAAAVTVNALLRNDTERDARVRARAVLIAPDGGETPLEAGAVSVKGGAARPVVLRGRLERPLPWSPDAPHLYTLSLRATAHAAEADDIRSETAPFSVGVRTARFDPDTGFWLNGQPLKILGVCLHHDAGCLGAAVWPDVWRRRLEKLKDMGCNAIRMSHNPHMPELYDLCDELGFLVMDEAFDEWIDPKNKWTHGHNVYPPAHGGDYADFPAWGERDLADMVLRDRNHPSVVMWSLGNEIDYPNDPYVHPLFLEMAGNNDKNKPAEEMRYNPDKPDAHRLVGLAARLADVVRGLDPTRPVLLASAFPELSAQTGLFDCLDMVGYNYKEALYDKDHARFPALPILGSETGHGLAAWAAVRDRAFIGGQFLWTGADYLGETPGWPVRGSAKGLLDLAGYEKTAWFRRKALWAQTPVAYLASARAADGPEAPPAPSRFTRRWDYVPGESVEVVCYTNLESAALFLNGASLGVRPREPDREYILWRVPFARGALRVVGAGLAAEDTLLTAQSSAAVKLSRWRPPEGARAAAGRWRMEQLEVTLTDEAGCLCPDGDAPLTVRVSGEARLAGLENGDLSDGTSYALPRRRAYEGRAIIYLLVAGPASVTVEGDGLRGAAFSFL
ncbi:MAG: DUF4982 domain-containing protein [Oscillospiraceae bacterium]|jgi:hypothetical protein|nr:DUF4982 domain-containing protein [Oscillospiraceae bacterium]